MTYHSLTFFLSRLSSVGQDAASLQNGIGSYASSIEHDQQRRAAALMEEQQFQNLRVQR
jgi:hypothetical protein